MEIGIAARDSAGSSSRLYNTFFICFRLLLPVKRIIKAADVSGGVHVFIYFPRGQPDIV
jgi:hypothetical protein